MTTVLARGLTPSECLERLATCSTGSVALSRGALPVIEPVRYHLVGDVVVLGAVIEGALADAVGEVITLGVHDLAPLVGDQWLVNVTGYATPLVPTSAETLTSLPGSGGRADGSAVVLSIALINGSRLGV